MYQRLSRFLKRHPRGFDAAVALLWTFLSIGADEAGDGTKYFPFFVGGFLLSGAALFWRRRFPLHVFGLQTAIIVLLTLIGLADPAPMAILCGAYSLAAYAPERRFSIAGLASLMTLGVAALLITSPSELPQALVVSLLISIAWVVGDSIRTRRAYQQSLIDRAERAEALRDSLAQQAVGEERTRIARDLHDVVAHSMSLMVVQAGAARRVVRTDAAAAESALGAIEEVGRNSLAEMRRILGVLRGDEGAEMLAPQPDIATIQALVDDFRAAELPVEFIITGEQRPLPASVELTAFRIVQESLTNVLKHAGRADATVEITYSPTELKVVVTDDGRSVHLGTVAAPGAQRGHLGMRERVAAFGGEFRAQPRLRGGFEVAVTIPLDPATSMTKGAT